MEQGARQAVRQEGQGGRAEPGGAQGRLRLRRAEPAEARPVPPRADERDARARSSSTATRPRPSAAMMAGVTVVAWYPITPSSSRGRDADRLHEAVPHRPATGKATFAIVQAEDELAAIGMVLGAGWAGARAMTATSGPRHLADVGVRGPRLLRRGAGGHLRRAARRAVDRPAHAHGAGRHPLDRVPLARRHQAHPAAPGSAEECYEHGDGGVRPGRALPDAGLRDDRPRPRA